MNQCGDIVAFGMNQAELDILIGVGLILFSAVAFVFMLRYINKGC